MKNCKKNALKSRKGITLIALVITIIVLLILAGISITMLTGDNSILQKTTEAKTESEKGQEKESVALAYTSALAKKVSNGDSTAVTASELNHELSNDNSVESVKGSNPIKVTFKSKRQYKVYSNGTVEYAGIKSGDDTDKTLVDMFKQAQEDNCDGTNCTNPANHLHIGDYVDYKNPTSGKYEYSHNQYDEVVTNSFEITSSFNQVNWRVLGLTNDEKSLKIIASTPVKITNNNDIPYFEGPAILTLNDDEWIDKTETILEEVSKLYKNEYAKEARSVSVDDFVQAFGNNIKNTGYVSELEEKTEVDEFTGDEWTYYEPKKIENTAILQLLFKGTKLYSGGSQRMYSHICGKFYYVSNNDGNTILATSRDGENSGNDLSYSQLLTVTGTCYGGIRPVIILDEDITTEEISKINSKDEEEWNYELAWYITCLDENGNERYNQ